MKMNIFQESNQLVAPGGLPTLLYRKEERDSRIKLVETDDMKITIDLIRSFLSSH